MPKILENVREKIIKEAKEIVLTEGYSKLTMRKISERSEIGLGTIYNYFPNKKDLAIDLMEDYWLDFLHFINSIKKEDYDFYTILRLIYEKLKEFLRNFIEVWLKDSRGYTKESLEKKQKFMDRFILSFEEILIYARNKGEINLPTSTYDTASFLVLNITMLVQMKVFEYEKFETIIRKVML